MFDLRLYKELFDFGHPVSGGDKVASGGLLPWQFWTELVEEHWWPQHNLYDVWLQFNNYFQLFPTL